eukprot:scaffold7228_cov78-Isochrysis_galbana.AAC.1
MQRALWRPSSRPTAMAAALWGKRPSCGREGFQVPEVLRAAKQAVSVCSRVTDTPPPLPAGGC